MGRMDVLLSTGLGVQAVGRRLAALPQQLPRACVGLPVRSTGLKRSQGPESPGSTLCLIRLESHCSQEALSGGKVPVRTSCVWFPACEGGSVGNTALLLAREDKGGQWPSASRTELGSPRPP